MINLLKEENDKIEMIPIIKIINEKIYSFFYEKKNDNNINNLNINGAWGSGKSTIVNNLEIFYKKRYKEEEEKIEWIIFNLWEYETIVNPYFKLINDILNKILSNDEAISKNLNTNTNKPKFEKSINASWKIPLLSLIGAEVKFDSKMLLKKDENDLNHLIKEMVAKINSILNENNKKIVIIFDEIDRCIPDNQIKFLSYIKNIFLEITNIFFIISSNNNLINRHLNKTIENDKEIEFENYTDKIFSVKIDLQYLFFPENYNFSKNPYITQFLTQVAESNPRQIDKIMKLLLSKTIKIIENIVFIENSAQEVVFSIEFIIFYCYYLKFKYPKHFEKIIQLTDSRLLNSNYMSLIKSEIISKYYDINGLEKSSLKKIALNVNINPSIPNKIIFGIDNNTINTKLYSLLLPFFGHFVSKKEPNIFFKKVIYSNSGNYKFEPEYYSLDLKNQSLEKHVKIFFEIFLTIYNKNKDEIEKQLNDKIIYKIIKNSIFDY